MEELDIRMRSLAESRINIELPESVKELKNVYKDKSKKEYS
jgi:hypothetical protein